MILKRGSKSPAVRSIQEMLRFLGLTGKEGAPLKPDGDFGENTEHAVLNFQASENLLRDGIVGSTTMAMLEKVWTMRSLELNSPGIDSLDGMPDRLIFERVPADLYGGEGYDRLSLRSDVATAYNKIYKEVHRCGGMLTSSGGIRSLNVNVNSSRSVTSMHYIGRALDLFIYSGMVDPAKDPYIISQEAPLTYRVYARCSKTQNKNAKLPPEIDVENVMTYETFKRGLEKQTVTGHFLDLTGLFLKHGFHSIRAKPLFEQGRSMMGAEWWHFQYQEGLIEGATTFGYELLTVYSRKTLENTPPWQYQDRVYGLNWF